MAEPTKLLNRNYVLQWQGQSVSQVGSQVFVIAMLFWIKHATGSAALMGLLQMLSSVPAVLLAPIGGAFADRYSRRKIIILSDLSRGIAVLSLASLIFIAPHATGAVITGLFIVSIFVNAASAFLGPAISATIPDLVPQDKVVTANSMGQSSVQLAVFLGQGLGGALFRLLGAPVLFLMNGMTYLFAVTSESFVVIPQAIPEKSKDWREQLTEFRRDILDGMHYVWHRKGLREAVFVSVLLGFFTTPIIILLPFYVEDVLRVSVDWYGFLLAAYGVGSLLGYLFTGAIRTAGKTRGRLMMLFIGLESAGYGLLSLVRNPMMAMALACSGGFIGGFVTVNITTMVQITTPGEIRGRVFGLLSAISGSLAPVAMGLAGVAADLMDQNIPLIYLLCGGIMALVSVSASLNRDFRSFLAYEQKDTTPHKIERQAIPSR